MFNPPGGVKIFQNDFTERKYIQGYIYQDRCMRGLSGNKLLRFHSKIPILQITKVPKF